MKRVLALVFAVGALAVLADPPAYDQLNRLIEAVNRSGSGGGGGPGTVRIDNKTVTTNYAAGAYVTVAVSVYGARTAEPGSSPHMGSDGKIVWTPDTAMGGTLVIEGVSGTTTTTATCTNKLTFVSSPESNVKFTVTDKGDGNVEVSVGVFYK